MNYSSQALTVYVDMLFFENLIINFFILWLSKKIIKSQTSSLRLFVGAFIGACYVILLLVVPGVKAYYTGAAKIILSFFIVAVSFNPKKVVDFVKTLCVFYVSTFTFAGAAFAFLYFNGTGGFVRNGIVYFFANSRWTSILLSVLTVGIITVVVRDIWLSRHKTESLLIPINISIENKTVSFDALVDTGNSLCDPLSKLPVVVVEFDAICNILPNEIRGIFEGKQENDLSAVTSAVSKSSWFSRFRLIPFSSLGKENGMLIGFKPDFILIGTKEAQKNICEVVVGIYNRTLSRNNSYKALLGPDLVA